MLENTNTVCQNPMFYSYHSLSIRPLGALRAQSRRRSGDGVSASGRHAQGIALVWGMHVVVILTSKN
jgi:hypothetical protein